uniref:Uncharacterized protein n=1 Tax=Chromera velia CCMP2878 TaxID=1169474 RepID=A0A0G4HRB9_9ALVE|eukprot:Cvel_8044.t1-p1 / transcript=Cvel_8044.t1 / gene=Cvel_8044 / organism=Chromera_velia_CCMP2878 / gene_product=Kinesin light chain, putative / transcript_product=Kinesin light chain, putative / location=Cvel_scaffold435:36308-37915(+) / protein_length=433 / sequence_SO=supercontig / SO=protein_coding / is_pseudo=false
MDSVETGSSRAASNLTGGSAAKTGDTFSDSHTEQSVSEGSSGGLGSFGRGLNAASILLSSSAPELRDTTVSLVGPRDDRTAAAFSDSDGGQTLVETVQFFCDGLKEMSSDYDSRRFADALAQFDVSRDGLDYYVFSEEAVQRLTHLLSDIPVSVLLQLCKSYGFLAGSARVSPPTRDKLADFLLHSARTQKQRTSSTDNSAAASSDELLHRALHVKACELREQGRYEEAMQMCKEALAEGERIFGYEHPDTVLTMKDMAIILFHQGKHEEALHMMEEVLRVRRKVLGDKHHVTATTVSKIGLLLVKTGKPKEALLKFEEALRIEKESYGDEHPVTAITINNIAEALLADERNEEAMEKLEEAFRFFQQSLGEEDPHAAHTVNNMGVILEKEGKYSEALLKYQEAWRVRKKVSGDEHPETKKTFQSVTRMLQQQ